MDIPKLIVLGTGNAAVTKCYNTCFVISNENSFFLVDAGGGNGVLSQLEKAQIPLASIHDMFITHAHTDHILGAVWILRMVTQQTQKGKYQGVLQVYGHEKVVRVLRQICELTLPGKILKAMEQTVSFHVLEPADRFTVAGMQAQCFDIASTKEKQFGFRLCLPNGRILACLGDEPFNESVREYVDGADWLMSEAFCLYAQKDVFKPYEKHHSTALDAGRLAQSLHTRNLVLYHTEDSALEQRKDSYMQEARTNFDGNVFVPDDLEVIPLV